MSSGTSSPVTFLPTPSAPSTPVSPDLDLSLPTSALLRIATAAAHSNAEESGGAKLLVGGQLEYARFVQFTICLHEVYSELERGLDENSANPALAPTYNPALLARTSALSSDLAHLLQTPTWRKHPFTQALLSSPPATLTAYTSRLRTIAASSPELLLSHAYVRYLGDLSGGQVIKRSVAKAYGLSGGEGLEFFEFGTLGGAKGKGKGEAGLGEMKRIKEWYRDGMDEGVKEEKAKAALAAEANTAFRLNSSLFASLTASAPSLPPLPNPFLAAPSFTASSNPWVALAQQHKPKEPRDWLALLWPFLIGLGVAHAVVLAKVWGWF